MKLGITVNVDFQNSKLKIKLLKLFVKQGNLFNILRLLSRVI